MNAGRMLSGLRWAVVGIASLYILIYLFIAVSRMDYPFELEWNEGGLLVQVDRILNGLPLYDQPSLEYVAYVYPPVYFVASTAMARLVGADLLALRLVSFLASLGCFALIFLIVLRKTRDRAAAWIAVGLFAATYRLGGVWLDVARVDTLLLFFVLAGIYSILLETDRAAVAGGLCFALAFLTKQTALGLFIPIALASFALNRRRGCIVSVVSVASGGAATLYLMSLYHPWYQYFVFELPSHHRIRTDLPLSDLVRLFWVNDTLVPLPWVCTLVAFTLAGFRKFRIGARDAIFYTLTLSAVIATSWLLRMISGSHQNILLPMYAIFAMLFGVGLHSLRTASVPSSISRRALPVVVELVSLVQFAHLRYPVLRQIPTQEDRLAGQRIVASIAEFPGSVYLPYNGYLARKAGKACFAQQGPTGEISGDYGVKDPVAWEAWRAELRAALKKQSFSLVITSLSWMHDDLSENYVPRNRIFADKMLFRPVAGFPLRPQVVWYPVKHSASDPTFSAVLLR